MTYSLRSVLVIIGNIIYHFDRSLFNLLIPFLAPLFFPQIDPVYALICMFAIAPLEVFVKPLGALFFGYWGDRIGRRKILSITLIGMAIKTGLMGFLPTYEQIGVFAPVLLAFTRLAISFFAAGETTGGAIFLLEHTKGEKRNLISSLFDASGILGVFLASCSIGLMHAFPDFWRILFWSGGLIGIIGWMFRKLPEDEELHASPSLSCWCILWEHKHAVMAIASVAGFSYANYYLITNFMNGFLPLVSSITKVEAISLNSLLLGIDFVLLPLFGIISLKVPKKVLMIGAILGMMGCAAPLFLLLQEATLFNVACVRIALTVLGVCLAAPYHAWAYERSPPQHRYLVGAFGTALGAKLLGGPLPAVSLWLYHQTGLIIVPALPLVIIGIFPLVYLMRGKASEEMSELRRS